MNDDDHIVERTIEDAKEERCMRILLQRLQNTTVRVAHCHECRQMDPEDPYRPLCDWGHIMRPCIVTKYRLMVRMAQAGNN